MVSRHIPQDLYRDCNQIQLIKYLIKPVFAHDGKETKFSASTVYTVCPICSMYMFVFTAIFKNL